MNIKTLTLLLISLLSVGCQSTVTALQTSPPEKYVEVISSDEHPDVEESLKASGISYVCKEFYAGKGSSKNRRACFVKAPPSDKYDALGAKMSDVSIAILKDTGRTILVVGQIALSLILFGYYES
jgi:hypothetical protein